MGYVFKQTDMYTYWPLIIHAYYSCCFLTRIYTLHISHIKYFIKINHALYIKHSIQYLLNKLLK